MDIRKVLVLRGPNVWGEIPVVEAWVDLGPVADSTTEELPGFSERLAGWLPRLTQQGDFAERLRRGTSPADVLENVALELQRLAGADVRFGRSRETSEERVYKVAFEYVYEDL